MSLDHSRGAGLIMQGAAGESPEPKRGPREHFATCDGWMFADHLVEGKLCRVHCLREVQEFLTELCNPVADFITDFAGV